MAGGSCGAIAGADRRVAGRLHFFEFWQRNNYAKSRTRLTKTAPRAQSPHACICGHLPAFDIVRARSCSYGRRGHDTDISRAHILFRHGVRRPDESFEVVTRRPVATRAVAGAPPVHTFQPHLVPWAAILAPTRQRAPGEADGPPNDFLPTVRLGRIPAAIRAVLL